MESGILRAEKVTDVLTRRLTRRLPLAAVPYLSAINDEWLRDLPVSRKRHLWTIVSRSRLAVADRLAEVRLNETITLDLEGLAGTRTRNALAYRVARDIHLVADDTILGGTPVIRDTRLRSIPFLGVSKRATRSRTLSRITLTFRRPPFWLLRPMPEPTRCAGAPLGGHECRMPASVTE